VPRSSFGFLGNGITPFFGAVRLRAADSTKVPPDPEEQRAPHESECSQVEREQAQEGEQGQEHGAGF